MTHPDVPVQDTKGTENAAGDPLTHITGIVRSGQFFPLASGSPTDCADYWRKRIEETDEPLPEGRATFVNVEAILSDSRVYRHDGPYGVELPVAFWDAFDRDPAFHALITRVYQRHDAKNAYKAEHPEDFIDFASAVKP